MIHNKWFSYINNLYTKFGASLVWRANLVIILSLGQGCRLIGRRIGSNHFEVRYKQPNWGSQYEDHRSSEFPIMKFLKQLSSSISLKKDEFYNVALCYTFLNEAPAVHTSKFTSHIPFCESVIMEAPTWSGIMWTTKTTKKIQRKIIISPFSLLLCNAISTNVAACDYAD